MVNKVFDNASFFIYIDWLNQLVTKFKDGDLGDGQCHIALNVPECCFDGGDCIICPTCDPDLRIHVNDGICDADLLKADCCCATKNTKLL